MGLNYAQIKHTLLDHPILTFFVGKESCSSCTYFISQTRFNLWTRFEPHLGIQAIGEGVTIKVEKGALHSHGIQNAHGECFKLHTLTEEEKN